MAGLQLPIDECLKEKIKDLVQLGVKNVNEMERHLNIYVERELLKGRATDKTNRRYYPLRSDIRNHMYTAMQSLRYDKPMI